MRPGKARYLFASRELHNEQTHHGSLHGGHKHGRHRRGYFFIVDAFIAGIILFGAFVLLLTRTQSAPASGQAYLTLDSFVEYVTTQQVRDISNPVIDAMIVNGDITDPSLTVFEQTAWFYDCGAPCSAKAHDLVDSIAQGSIPEQFGFAYIINGTVVDTRYPDTEQKTPLLATEYVVTYFAKNITSFVGPYATEVRIWTK